MIRLEPREEMSKHLLYLTPVMAVALTIVLGIVMFLILGKNPVRAITIIFVTPLTDLFTISEMIVKATPLILIGIGLSFGFRAGVWNIGAEGQFTIGALIGGVLPALNPVEGFWVLPLMCAVRFDIQLFKGRLRRGPIYPIIYIHERLRRGPVSI